MPPSPVITGTLDVAKYEAACDLLGLDSDPGIRIIRGPAHPTKNAYGVYSWATNCITVTLGMAEYDFDKLRFVMSELAITVLHELRHAWQTQEMGRAWIEADITRAEVDAEGWAKLHAAEFAGIIRVSRKFHGSGLSRLDRTTASIRRDL